MNRFNLVVVSLMIGTSFGSDRTMRFNDNKPHQDKRALALEALKMVKSGAIMESELRAREQKRLKVVGKMTSNFPRK